MLEVWERPGQLCMALHGQGQFSHPELQRCRRVVHCSASTRHAGYARPVRDWESSSERLPGWRAAIGLGALNIDAKGLVTNHFKPLYRLCQRVVRPSSACRTTDIAVCSSLQQSRRGQICKGDSPIVPSFIFGIQEGCEHASRSIATSTLVIKETLSSTLLAPSPPLQALSQHIQPINPEFQQSPIIDLCFPPVCEIHSLFPPPSNFALPSPYFLNASITCSSIVKHQCELSLPSLFVQYCSFTCQ